MITAPLDDPTLGNLDVNLFDLDGSGNPEDFTLGTTAFTGSIVVPFDGPVAALLPANDYVGFIYAGYAGDLPDDATSGLPFLGEYEVFFIPEPSQWSLLLLGVAALIAVRRFRPSRANS